MKYISTHAIKLVLGILIAVILFHVCIMLKIIPYQITWGGRLKSDAEMYVFESISILINLFLSLVLCMNGDYISYKFSDKFITVVLWFFVILFAANTLGNLFAKTNLEKTFALLTLISSFLLWQIVRSKKEQ
jgi:hypothetical protein